MTTIATTPFTNQPDHLAMHDRRRRTALQTGPAALAPQPATQLPFAARVGVSVHGNLLYPIAGAVLGTLLLGLPGTLIGAGIGFLLA